MPTLTYVGGTSASYTSLLTPKVVSYTATAGNLLVVDVWNYDSDTAVPLTVSDSGSGVWSRSNVNFDPSSGSASAHQFYCLSAASGVTTISLAGTTVCSGAIIISEYNTTSGYWNLDLVGQLTATSSSTSVVLGVVATAATNLIVHGFIVQGSNTTTTFSGASGYTIDINQSSVAAAANLASGHAVETSSGNYTFSATASTSLNSLGFATSFSVTSGSPSLGSIPQTNLVGWYMANQGVNNPSGILSIVDWSGQGDTLGTTGGNLMYPPGGTINGVPYIYVNSAFEVFNNDINLQSGLTVFLVFQVTNSSSKRTFFSGLSGSLSYWFDDSGSLQGADKCFVADLGGGSAGEDTLWHQTNITYDNTNVYYRKDQAPDGNFSPGAALSANQHIIGCTWGGGESGSEVFAGNWAELIVYNAVLNSTQIGQVETYLQQKYFPVVVTYRLLPLLGVGI